MIEWTSEGFFVHSVIWWPLDRLERRLWASLHLRQQQCRNAYCKPSKQATKEDWRCQRSGRISANDSNNSHPMRSNIFISGTHLQITVRIGAWSISQFVAIMASRIVIGIHHGSLVSCNVTRGHSTNMAGKSRWMRYPNKHVTSLTWDFCTQTTNCLVQKSSQSPSSSSNRLVYWATHNDFWRLLETTTTHP